MSVLFNGGMNKMNHWNLKKDKHYNTKAQRRLRYIRRKRKERDKYIYIFGGKWNSISFQKFINKSDFINNRRKRLKFLGNKQSILIEVPEIFSLLDNAEETMAVYNQIFEATKNNNLRNITIDHRKCKTLELSASVVMDIFIINMKNHKDNLKLNYELNGFYSEDKHINDILEISGITKQLGLNDKIDTLVERSVGIEKLDLIKGGRHTETLKIDTNVSSGAAGTLFIEYLQRCLATLDLKMVKKGEQYLSSIVGEVVDNCDLHSGEFKQWFMLGNFFQFKYNQSDNEGMIGECNLVLFNFGQSIHEGLKSSSKEQSKIDDIISRKMFEKLNELTDYHQKKGFFSNYWDEEILWTLYSLQEGVSRCLSKEDSTRGIGTVNMIEALHEIGDTHTNDLKPEFYLISGKSKIIFENQYKLKDFKGQKSKQIIAFNNNNNLQEPPNSNNVIKMKSYFPGTLISLKFYIDEKYLEGKIINEN